MDDIRKRVLSELLLAPSVVLPMAAGLSAWMLSWASGGVDTLNVIGLVAVLGSIGWLATRWIFGVESTTQKILREQAEKIIRAEEEKLDQLMLRLRTDRDPRTNDFLTLLRTTKSEFEEIAKQPGIAIRSLEIVKQVRQLFWSAIDQLENSLKLHALAERIAGQDRGKILQEREAVLSEIRRTIDHLQTAVKHYRELMKQELQTDMNELRDELDTSIQIAKRTEERMRELEISSNIDSYLKQ